MAQHPTPLVLVADDEPAMRELVELHLRRMAEPRVDVISAEDGEEAWKLARERLPDLVVLDVMMPGMSGWEVCQKIRQDVAAFAHTGVLMLTGIGETVNALTSPLYGADGYIDKPFDPELFQEKVRDTLEKRAILREAVDRPSTVHLESAPTKKLVKKPAPTPAAKAPAAKAPAANASAAKAPAAKAPAAKAPAAKASAAKAPAAKAPAAKAPAAKAPAAKAPAAKAPAAKAPAAKAPAAKAPAAKAPAAEAPAAKAPAAKAPAAKAPAAKAPAAKAPAAKAPAAKAPAAKAPKKK
jgi:CheY-like chemotaxis protein